MMEETEAGKLTNKIDGLFDALDGEIKKFLLRSAERIWPPSGARAERGRMERGAA